MTGFTGSAGSDFPSTHTHTSLNSFDLATGITVVTAEGAWLWTDGRYHLQASQEINPDLWTLMKQGLNLQCKYEFALPVNVRGIKRIIKSFSRIN